MTASIIVACIIVFLTHTIEAITGFGCTVLALPFVVALVGFKDGIVALTVIAWLLAFYFVITKWHQINFKHYFVILFNMLIGIPLGIYLFHIINTDILKRVLGIFICIISAWQLYKLSKNMYSTEKKALPYPAIDYAMLIIGGIIHGMFSSGGPFAVLYAGRRIKEKGNFRATMCLLWVTLNSIIIGGYIFNREFNITNGKLIIYFIPFLIAGIYVGEKIHNKVNARVFSMLIFSILLISGILSLIFN